jgi:hypothetical protein
VVDQLRPTREPVLTGEHELRVRQRGRIHHRPVSVQALRRGGVTVAQRPQKILGLLAQLLERRASRETRRRRICHDDLLSMIARVRATSVKEDR